MTNDDGVVSGVLGSDSNAPPIGVYGKVRSQPDFLRANAGEFSQAGLDRWFQDAVEIMCREAIDQIQPFAVDACTSLETSPGRKDVARIKAFVRAVRNS